MLDFTQLIPSKIFLAIFSHVNQVDLIECMFVCRSWYKLIVGCAKDILKELEISETSWPRFNNAMSECLGTHVRKVSIIGYENSNKILRRLKSHSCDIQSLEIKGRFRIYDLDLDYSTLFTGVGLLASTLKELYIQGPSTQYCPLSLLLDVLPSLTHLTFKLEGDGYKVLSEYEESIHEKMQQTIKTSNNNYNLVFLSLDSEFLSCYDLRQLLPHCLRLKYLMGSFYIIYEYANISGMAIENVVNLCPSIRYINWGEQSISSKVEKEWMALSRRKERKDINNEMSNNYGKMESIGLRQVGFCGDDELQHVSTLKASLREPSMLEQLHLTSTSGTDLCYVWNTFQEQNSNLLSQLPQLKSLEFVDYCVICQPGNEQFFEDLFSYFQHTKHLKLHFVEAAPYFSEEVRDYMSNLVQAIGHQLHQLQHFYLGFSYDDNHQTIVTICNYFFTTLCDSNQKLETLHLHNVPISNNMLLDLCHHPNLHTLKLSGYELHKQLTKDGLITFARKLKEQVHNNRSGGRIQYLLLSCGYCDDVTDQVLEELAGVRSLKILQIECNEKITDIGINKFASIHKNINNNHTKVELYECRHVSVENPHVVLVAFPFC